MDTRVGNESSYIKKIKNILIVIALIGALFTVLAELLIYYCITNVIPLFYDIVLRITILLIYTSISMIASIMGFHLLIDAIMISKGFESKLGPVDSGG